jgi:hypothetical protein
MFNTNWTWSHSIDDASDPGATLNETNLPQDVRNMAAEKASSSFDHRHRLAASFVYQFPEMDHRSGPSSCRHYSDAGKPAATSRRSRRSFHGQSR